MRIALWNASGLDNLGDRLLDRVNRLELRKRIPDASFQTFSPWYSTTTGFVSIDRNGSWQGERQFDAIVIGGGGLLIGPPFFHPSLQTCYLGPYPNKFKEDCPIIWNSVGIEAQFSHLDSWREYVRMACSRVTYRSVRDKCSAHSLDECGVQDPVSIVPDPVTLLRSPQKRKRRMNGKQRIGVVPGLPNFKNFITQVQSSESVSDWNPNVRADVVNGMPLLDLINLASESPKPRNEMINELATILSSLQIDSELEIFSFGTIYGDDQTSFELSQALNCQTYESRDSTGNDVMEWIESLDCLLASRFHACVMALAAGTPWIAIDPYFDPVSRTSKIHEFMDDIKLLDLYVPMDALLNGEALLGELIEQANSCRECLPDILESLSESAKKHFDLVSDVIRSRHVSRAS